MVKMPKPDQDVLAKRTYLVQALRDIVTGPGGVIDEEAGLRAFECDGLSAYRQLPMVAVLPSTRTHSCSLLNFRSSGAFIAHPYSFPASFLL